MKEISKCPLWLDMIDDFMRIILAYRFITKEISFMAAMGGIKIQRLTVNRFFKKQKLNGNKEGCKNPICSHQYEQPSLIFISAPNEPQALSKCYYIVLAIEANLRLGNIRSRNQWLFHLTITQQTCNYSNKNFVYIIHHPFIQLNLTMNRISLNTARFARKTFALNWEKNPYGTFIRFPNERNNSHVLCYIFPKYSFKKFFQTMNVPSSCVKYPHGIDEQSFVLDYLEDDKIPMHVEIKFENQIKYLKNIACDKQLRYIKAAIEHPNSIYKLLCAFAEASNFSDRSYTESMNYFLIHFYLRLTAQTFCKQRGIKANQIIDQNLKNEILWHLGQQYENHSPISIKIAEEQKLIIEEKIKKTKADIEAIETDCENKIYFYKLGVIVITAAHIVGFTYMIFYVDWLGWDIIEPLTYSIGVIYTLLGIRFYNKYRIDRNPLTIRDTLIKLVINAKKLVELKDLKLDLEMHEKQLKRSKTKARILKNHINFRTSFVNQLNNLS